MLNILAISDWRSQPIEDLYVILREIDPTPDLLLYAGDDLSRFKESETGTDHLAELARLTNDQLALFVRGNDDLPPEQGVQFDSEFTHDLHRCPYSLDRFAFLGQEGAVSGPGHITYTEEKVERHLARQRPSKHDQIPILVTHSPPNGILDIARRFGQRHIGSTAVRDFVEDAEPPLTVCGHCHQFGGRAEELEFGTVINIASHDGPNEPGRYAIISVEESRGTVELNYEFCDSRHHLGSRLTDLFQVRRNRVEQFNELGIESPEDITEDRRGELESLPGSSPWHVDRWFAHLRAIENEEILVLDPGAFDVVRRTNPLLLDIETDLNQDRVWLVGTYSYRDDSFVQFFDPDDEETLLQELVEHFKHHETDPIVYFGGNNFDEQCLNRRFAEHGLEEGIDQLERAHDIGFPVQQELFGPFHEYDLATVANALGYEYEYPDIDGFVVGSEYTSYMLDGIEPDWERLKGYNYDDVAALKTIVDYVRARSQNSPRR